MAVTLEDLDRRVTALEKAPETEKNIVRAVSEIVSASEKRLTERLVASEERTQTAIKRLDDRISATERRFTDLLNERFDAVMATLDGLKNP